jgi:chorismate mutase
MVFFVTATRVELPISFNSRKSELSTTWLFPSIGNIYNVQTMDDLEFNIYLHERREQLDELDRSIVRGLNERARLVQELAAIKRQVGEPLYDPKREEEILQRVAEENPGPIYNSTMREIFEIIMHRIRDIEFEL